MSGFTILTLYNCGSALLNHKLRKIGAVTQFSVHHGRDHYLPFHDWRNNNFRAIATFQSLRRLEFVGFASYSFRNFTTNVLAQFTPNLAIIHFDFIEALTMWIDLRPEAYGLKTLDYFAMTMNPQAFPLKSAFPALRELHLNTSYWDRYSIYPTPKEAFGFNWTPEMMASFVENLPESMVDLKLSRAPPLAAAHFPPYLEVLDWRVTEPYRDQRHPLAGPFGALIPREVLHLKLRNLDASAYIGVTSQLDLLGGLPDGLQSLEFSFDSARFSAPEVDGSDLKVVNAGFFPSNLTSLSSLTPVSFLTRDIISFLPQTLTVLNFESVSNALSDEAVPLFPGSLTILRLHRDAGNHGNRQPGLLTGACLLDLPKGLVEFATGSGTVWPWSALEYLPPTLKVLSHFLWTYASLPDQPESDKAEATQFWKAKASQQGCRLVCEVWDRSAREEDEEANPRAPLVRPPSPPINRRPGFRPDLRHALALDLVQPAVDGNEENDGNDTDGTDGTEGTDEE